MRTSTRVATAILTVVTGLALAGCGTEASVRELDAGGSESGSGSDASSGSGSDASSGSGSDASSGSGSGSGSAIAAAEAACAPVNEDLEADATETVAVSLTEYAFEPSELRADSGIVTFATSNDGQEPHEFAVLPGGGDVPLTEDGAPDEDALAAAGAFELEAYGPDQDCNATWELEAGEYTLFCIVEAPDGETHASKGMVGTLTVS